MSKTYQTTIHNSKLILPPEVRERFFDYLYITKGTIANGKSCFLSLYSEKEWEDFQKDLQKLNLYERIQRSIRRFFLYDAYKLDIIKNNLIVIPKSLLDYIHIDTENKTSKIPVSIICDPDAEKKYLKCMIWK